MASLSSREAGAGTAALALAARRLTGIDASRSGLGGYRWQLELALLANASPGSVPVTPQPTRAPVAAPASVRSSAPSSAAPSPPLARPPAVAPTPASGPARVPAAVAPAPTAAAATPAPSTPTPGGASVTGDLLGDILASWPAIVAWIGRNPLMKTLVTNCRPVEVRDGIVILGFPEDQPFLREKAEQRRSALEDGIAHVLGRPVGVRCMSTNIELPVAGIEEDIDLVAQARKVFGGELADVGDVG